VYLNDCLSSPPPAGGADKTLRLWDVDTGVCQRVLETPFPGLQIDCLKVFSDGELYSGTADGVLRSSNASPNHLSSFASLCFFTLSCASWILLDYWCLRLLGLAAVRFWDTNQRRGELVELLGGKGPSFECFKAERPPLRPWRHAEETICPASCGSYLATACVCEGREASCSEKRRNRSHEGRHWL
jgi:hypothetical protein